MPKEFQITGRPVSSNRVVHGAQNNDGMMAHPLLVNRRSSAPSNSHSRPSALSRIADGGFDISAFVDMSLFDDILGGHVFRGTIGNNRGGTDRLEVPSNGEPVFRISLMEIEALLAMKKLLFLINLVFPQNFYCSFTL